jgi:NhaP-type Na+/H+ or K+/H+ antiporter
VQENGIGWTGVALRGKELHATGDQVPSEALEDVERGERKDASTDPKLAHAYMAEPMMSFSVEIERIVELALMVLIGSVLSAHWRELLNGRGDLAGACRLFVVRPFSAAMSLLGSPINCQHRALIGWLGIRGVVRLLSVVRARALARR